jgi:uncharacterized protein YjiS (DUF1127 family)
MGIIRFEHSLNAKSVSARHDIVFGVPHRSATIKDSFPYCDADHDEMGQIAVILAIFESAWNRPPAPDGNLKCEKCMSGSPIPRLPLPARSHHVAVQQPDGPPKEERNKKVISLKTISEKLNTWRRHREAVRELSQLSDHELSDIGIGRGDIEYVARRPVARKASAGSQSA